MTPEQIAAHVDTLTKHGFTEPRNAARFCRGAFFLIQVTAAIFEIWALVDLTVVRALVGLGLTLVACAWLMASVVLNWMTAVYQQLAMNTVSEAKVFL